jgi:uncharacterized SAM-binding protein YcdF (DUF218 family)
MFFFLSKFLPPFIYPLGLACLLVIAALLLTRRRRWQQACLLLALGLLWLGGNRWVSLELARSLEWRYLPPEEIPQADAIVLLGGGTLPAEYPRTLVEVGEAGDRVIYAAWLYNQGKAEHILSSGGLADWSSRQRTPAEDMQFLLEMMGVPPDAIWLQPDSLNTLEDALFSARILREQGAEKILLVTSATHMPRSVRLFEAQGFEVIPAPTDFVVTQSAEKEAGQSDWRAHLINLLPSAENLALTTKVLKEYIGIFVYDLRGWK